MAAATSLANVEKLTEANYELWKIQMKSILVFNELWQYVDGTEVKPLANAQDWIKKDSKALGVDKSEYHARTAQPRKEGRDVERSMGRTQGNIRITRPSEEGGPV